MKFPRFGDGVALAAVVALGVLGGACTTASPGMGVAAAPIPAVGTVHATGRAARSGADRPGADLLAGAAQPDAPSGGELGAVRDRAAVPDPGDATVPADVAAWRARLPHFGPPPPVVPVPLPAGPLAPVLSRVPTTAPVVFLTIDDGLVRRPEALPMLRAVGIPVTLFLIGPVAARGYPYFAGLASAGAVIEAHTQTHPEMAGTPYEFQRRQICDSADELGRLSGRRPVLFRPPYGSYDRTTLRAAHDCGMRAVVVWTQAARNGHVVYQSPEHRLHPGDVILMHFRDRYADDFGAALAAIHRDGLTPALLEDCLAPAGTAHRPRAASPGTGAAWPAP